MTGRQSNRIAAPWALCLLVVGVVVSVLAAPTWAIATTTPTFASDLREQSPRAQLVVIDEADRWADEDSEARQGHVGYGYDEPANLMRTNARLGGDRVAPNTGPVRMRPPAGATADEIAQVQAYCRACNQAMAEGALSPTGRVSTAGELRASASRAAAQERAAGAAAGRPYTGHAGHVPDTTWTGTAEPWGWMDLSPRVNTSLGGQAGHYPVGWQPTGFVYEGPL